MKRNIQLTEEQLKSFKLKVLEFYKLYSNLTNYFDDSIATTCEVLVQNLSFNGSDCQGYSHEKELEKVNNILDLLEQIKNYNTYYLTLLAFEEIDNILMGIYYND